MTKESFKLIVTGRPLPGTTPAAAKSNAQRLLNLPREKLDHLFDGGPPLVFSNLDQKSALRHQGKLKNAGLETRIQKGSAKSLRLTCPQCRKAYRVKGNLTSNRMKCPACGVDMSSDSTGEASRDTAPPLIARSAVIKEKILVSKSDRLLNDLPEDPTDEEIEDALSVTGKPLPSPKKKLKFKHLSDEAREIVVSKKIEGRRRAGSLVRLLRELARFDRSADAKRKRLDFWAGVFGVLACIILYLGIRILEHELFIEGWIAIGVSILCLLGSLCFFIWRFSSGKSDLANDFHQLLLPFLFIILPDIPRRGKVHLNLDLAGFSKEKILRDEELDPGRFKYRILSVFRDPWCEMEIPLIGGARLRLEIVNTQSEENRNWKNENRKDKYKQKYKKTVVVKMELMLGEGPLQYDPWRLAGLSSQEKIKYSDEKGKQRLRLVRKYKFKQNNEELDITAVPDDLVEMYFLLATPLKSKDGPDQVR